MTMHQKFLISAAALALSACGGSNPTPLTGQFVDAAVVNIEYETSSGLKGMTDADGSYHYAVGDTITFRIGALTLGSGTARDTITPVDLVPGASSMNDAQVVKILQVLQTLDEDDMPANGIQISAAVQKAMGTEPRRLQDLDDLQVAVVNRVQSVLPGRMLKDADAAKAHFADTLSRLAALRKISELGGVSNFVIGGGGKNCSSFNGDRQSSNCAADWTSILAKDEAFAGMSKDQISFDADYVMPSFSYSLTQANRDKFNAVPTALFDTQRKAAVLAAVNKRLSTTGAQTGLTFDTFEGGKPVYVDGNALWGTQLSDNDFNTLVDTVCPSDCTLSAATIDRLAAATFESSDHQSKALLVLNALNATYDNQNLTYSAFRTAFKAQQLAQDGSPAAGLTSGLNPAERAVLRSAFVDPNAQTRRKIEARTVKFLSNQASKDIYTQFVVAAKALAGGSKPKIGVVTASADNAFYDADINIWAFKSAGADVIYLPLNGGLRRATDAKQCADVVYHYDAFANTYASAEALHMDLVYPEFAAAQAAACSNPAQLITTLESLNGIYFSGGDQARHLESLFSKTGTTFTASPELTTLRKRFNDGQLVVSGTSAGNHIQGGGTWNHLDVPMIGGGDSYAALTTGFTQGGGAALETPAAATRYAQGGHGFFKYGVLDSHFSQRAREGRLVRATQEGGMDYGFGVDENTALVVGKPDANGTPMTVLGAGGVFVADVRRATASAAANGNYAIQGVKAHYLVQGDTLRITASGELVVNLSTHAARPVLPKITDAVNVTQTQIMDYGSANFLKMARAMGLTGAAAALGRNIDSKDGRTVQTQPYSLVLTRGVDTVFRGSKDRVSYTQLDLAIAPQ